jgi:hypothetical protein
LIDALNHYGFDDLDAQHKTLMRDRILQGGPFTEEEKAAILRYCLSDVIGLIKLLPLILADAERLPHPAPGLYLKQAAFRGQFMCANAKIENRGIPFDPVFRLVQEHWNEILHNVVEQMDANYSVYEGIWIKDEPNPTEGQQISVRTGGMVAFFHPAEAWKSLVLFGF